MKKRSIFTNGITWLFIVLLISVVLTSYFSGNMLARYRASSAGGDSARVAEFKVTAPGEYYMEGFDVESDGRDYQSSQLFVAPHNPVAVLHVINESETAIRCTVKVETTGNLPLKFYISEGDATKTVDYVDISVGNNDPVDINLRMEWPSSEDSYLYHREIDHVIVTLVCEQLD